MTPLDRARKLVAAAATEMPDALALAQVVSLAARIEPELVRLARVRLLPAIEAGAEADLWFSRLARPADSTALVLDPQVADLLRAEIAQPDHPIGLARAHALIQEAHRAASATVRLEETLVWLGLRSTQQTAAAQAHTQRRIERLLQNVLAELSGEAERAERIARWAASVLPHLPGGVRAAPSYALIAVAASLLLDGRHIADTVPVADLSLDALSDLLPANLGTIPVQIRLRDNALELGKPKPNEKGEIEIPQTAPLVLQVSWQQDSQLKSQLLMWRDGEEKRLEITAEQFWLRTLRGARYVVRPRTPTGSRTTNIETPAETPALDQPTQTPAADRQTQSSQANQSARKPPQLEPLPLSPRVLMIVFNPVVNPQTGARLIETMQWNDPHILAADFIADVNACSGSQVTYRLAETTQLDALPSKADGFRYTPQAYVDALRTQAGAHDPDLADYAAILQMTNAVARVADDEIDEVWLFGGPFMGLREAAMGGKDAFFCGGEPLRNTAACPRRFLVMGFTCERGVGEMLENLGHRAENILARVFHAEEFLSWAYTSSRLPATVGTRTLNLFERFLCFDQIAPGKANVGTQHHAPNSPMDFAWGVESPVPSCADDWERFPNLPAPPNYRMMNARDWGGGDVRAHHHWWLRHLPKAAGGANGIAHNWWRYVIDPNAVGKPFDAGDANPDETQAVPGLDEYTVTLGKEDFRVRVAWEQLGEDTPLRVGDTYTLQVALDLVSQSASFASQLLENVSRFFGQRAGRAIPVQVEIETRDFEIASERSQRIELMPENTPESKPFESSAAPTAEMVRFQLSPQHAGTCQLDLCLTRGEFRHTLRGIASQAAAAPDRKSAPTKAQTKPKRPRSQVKK